MTVLSGRHMGNLMMFIQTFQINICYKLNSITSELANGKIKAT